MGIETPDKLESTSLASESQHLDPLALLAESSAIFGKSANSVLSLPGMEITGDASEKVRLVGEPKLPTEPGRAGDNTTSKKAEAGEKNEFSMGSTPEREKLLNSIEKANDIPQKEKMEMIRDIKALEARAVRDFVSRQEILGVYENVSRLLDAKGNEPVTRSNRIVLAEQVLDQSAHPMSIDQGYHQTCNVTTIEARMYSKYPSKAAELVADVALTGKFETSNPRDNDVVLDKASLRPDKEASTNPPKDGERSYASQVFQLTAANIFWQGRSFDNDHNPVRKGDLRYVQIEPVKSIPGDTGERVRNARGETITSREDGKNVKIMAPDLSLNSLIVISNEISGRDEEKFILSNAGVTGPEEYKAGMFHNAKELAKMLTDQKNQYPLILAVHTYHDPFWKDSGHGDRGGAGGEEGGWHVINITGFNEKTGEVQISNQWGDRTDKKVALSTLYKATFGPPKSGK